MATLQWIGVSFILTAALAAGLAGGCGGVDTGGQGSTSSGGAGGSSAGGLPCDIEALTTAKCVACHSSPPVSGAPMPLLSYNDFLAHSKSTPTKTYAELAVERMQNMLSPMPPMGNTPVTAQDIAAMAAWVQGGTPKGACDADAGPNPFNMPPTCSNMTTWTMGNEGSNLMYPGQPCVACHALPPVPPDLPPPLIIGGTVYRTGHEPNDCNGGPADPLDKAMVEITDANQKVYMLQVNAAGNFFWAVDQGSIAMPFTARVLYQGKSRAMTAAQKDGDCNGCHTQTGMNGAPGRIALP